MKKNNYLAILFFFAIFFSMCFLRLWYTLLLVLILAFTITLISGKRNYCSNICPVGFIQDYMHDPEKKPKPINHQTWLRRIIFALFWGYIILYISFLYHQPVLLWSKMLQLMLFSLTGALILQYLFRKRYWCIYLCPVGGVLGRISKLRRLKSNKL